MANTQADLDALNEAIASGHLRVRYSDKEITYRRLDEMLAAKAILEAELGVVPAGPTPRTGRQVRMITGTGF